MVALEDQHPGYGLARHKGYGTPQHQAGLQELGASPIHRISYAPVAARQRPDEGLPALLGASLDQCASVTELQAWVGTALRPAYGRLKLAWVEALRRRYAERLAQLGAAEGQAQ